MRRLTCPLMGLLLALAMPGCGGRAHEPESPAPAAAPEVEADFRGGQTPAPLPSAAPKKQRLDSIEDAEAALADDLADVEAALGQPIPTAEVGQSACNRVCYAVGSMRRSVDAICDLAGEDDQRCRGARNTLERSERRVANAGCRC